MSIQFDIVGIENAIDGLQKTGKGLGLTLQWMVWDIARLAAADCMKYSAPWAGGKSAGNGLEQKKAGERSIGYELLGRGDFRGLFAAMEEIPYSAEKGNWSREAPGYALLRNKAGAVWLVDKDFFRPHASEADLRRFHLANRTPSGHVSRSQNKGRNSRTIGRWKASNKLYAKKTVVDSYVGKVKARVGEMKASWIPALNYFAQKTNSSPRIPRWIARHAGEGEYADTVGADGSGRATLTSNAHHGPALTDGSFAYVEKKRNADIGKWLPKRMEKIAQRFNAGTPAAAAVKA